MVQLADTFSRPARSQVMRSVHSTGTRAEKKCQALLCSLKLPFKCNAAELPGKPDFALNSCRLALFVHGCFWHAHQGCKHAKLPASNVSYWKAKIDGNRR